MRVGNLTVIRGAVLLLVISIGMGCAREKQEEPDQRKYTAQTTTPEPEEVAPAHPEPEEGLPVFVSSKEFRVATACGSEEVESEEFEGRHYVKTANAYITWGDESCWSHYTGPLEGIINLDKATIEHGECDADGENSPWQLKDISVSGWIFPSEVPREDSILAVNFRRFNNGESTLFHAQQAPRTARVSLKRMYCEPEFYLEVGSEVPKLEVETITNPSDALEKMFRAAESFVEDVMHFRKPIDSTPEFIYVSSRITRDYRDEYKWFTSLDPDTQQDLIRKHGLNFARVAVKAVDESLLRRYLTLLAWADIGSVSPSWYSWRNWPHEEDDEKVWANDFLVNGKAVTKNDVVYRLTLQRRGPELFATLKELIEAALAEKNK